MAYDEKAADRARAVLADVPQLAEIKMMGALIFTVRKHMCCGITKDGLMVRVGPANYDAALAKSDVQPLDIGGGRQPRAFICVAPKGFATQRSLTKWIQSGLDFVDTLPDKKATKKTGKTKPA